MASWPFDIVFPLLDRGMKAHLRSLKRAGRVPQLYLAGPKTWASELATGVMIVG
jgi:hypothetical protein